MNNPIQLLQTFMTNKGNPQQLLLRAMSMMENNNPMIENLVNMANSGDTKGVEQFARNILKEKGIDFDKEFPNFMNSINKR